MNIALTNGDLWSGGVFAVALKRCFLNNRATRAHERNETFAASGETRSVAVSDGARDACVCPSQRPADTAGNGRARRCVAIRTNAGCTYYLPVLKVFGRLSLIVVFIALQLTSLAGGLGGTIPMGDSAAIAIRANWWRWR